MPGTFFSPELAADIATSCAAELGLRPTVADLSTVTPAQLSAAGDAVGAKTAFATQGDPGWPAYDDEERLMQIFDTQPAIAAYPEETSRLIWQDYTFPVLPLVRRVP